MKLIQKIKGPEFTKVAAKILLGDNPSTYPSELIANLYKQHPYLGKYQVNISIEGQDPSMGYMYGVFLVSHASDAPPPPGVQKMGEVISQGQPAATDPASSVRIPIIVENKRAYSFDVFITPAGKFQPLNESRISSELFEASPFAMAPAPVASQAASATPAMPSGSEGRDAPMNATTKMASALFSNIDRDSVKSFMSEISRQSDIEAAFQINPVFADSLRRLVDESETGEVAKTASTEFTSAIVSKTGGGFSIKTSNNLDIGPSVEVSNLEAGEVFPVEIRQQVIKTGSALMSPTDNEGLVDINFTEGLSEVTESGVYSVMTKTGKAQRAVVIKDITRIDGTNADSVLVVGESGAAYQEKVAGIRCGDVDTSAIKGSDPVGEGVFIFKEAGIITEPVRVLHTITQDGEISLAYDHPLRGIGHLKVASVKKPVTADNNVTLIPEDYSFVPLTFGVRYADDPVSMDKIASRRSLINAVSIVSDGSLYSFRGSNINEELLSDLTKEASLLVLSDLGDTPEGAYKKLAQAKSGRTPKFSVTKPLVKKAATSTLDPEVVEVTNIIRHNFVKEAASLTNSETVDSVLSLNFITPENIAGYIDSIPSFEEASSKLAELLVGVRLGLSDVPEGAVSSALSGMERAITGLKKLQIRSNMVN